jgi:hypothetical protein
MVEENGSIHYVLNEEGSDASSFVCSLAKVPEAIFSFRRRPREEKRALLRVWFLVLL